MLATLASRPGSIHPHYAEVDIDAGAWLAMQAPWAPFQPLDNGFVR